MNWQVSFSERAIYFRKSVATSRLLVWPIPNTRPDQRESTDERFANSETNIWKYRGEFDTWDEGLIEGLAEQIFKLLYPDIFWNL